MKADNQSEHWAVGPEGPHTLLSSVNGQLNIVLACPHFLYSHINTHRNTHSHRLGRGKIAVQSHRGGYSKSFILQFSFRCFGITIIQSVFLIVKSTFAFITFIILNIPLETHYVQLTTNTHTPGWWQRLLQQLAETQQKFNKLGLA